MLFYSIDFPFLLLPLLIETGKRKKKSSEMEQIDCTPPEHILPGSKERPLVPLQPQNKDWKVRKAFRDLNGGSKFGF